MGSNSDTGWYAISIYVIILNLSFFSSFSLPIRNYSTHISLHSIDDYVYNYSSRSIGKRPQTGVLYNISLPANFSDMEVSVMRLRSSTLWVKGANFRSFDIPPRIITIPFMKRVEIMYENFGTLSSHYYELPGYTLLTNVFGLAIYDATDLSRTNRPKRLNITIKGQPIRVKFSHVQFHKGRKNVKHMIKCARFDPGNGIVELSNVVKSNVCSSQGLGHFAMAMPRVGGPPLSSSLSRKGRKERLWKWWLIGFGGGLAGIVLVVLIGVLGSKMIGSRKIRRMERSSEKSEALVTRWIGSSKMPSASMIRTQADTLENE